MFHHNLPSPTELPMDTKLLLSHPTALLLPSFPRPSRHLTTTHLLIPKLLPRTPFLGQRLDLGIISGETRPRTRTPSFISAAVKRRKEMPLDNVIQRDKKLKLVLKIRRILVSYPDRIMSLKELGKYRNQLGIAPNRRLIALLKRFPAVFEIIEEGVYSLKFRLTPEAERIYLEEEQLKAEAVEVHATKLRKLLMMSLQKRILLEKIAHLKTDLGLPLDFKETICQSYPQYFSVVRTDRGPALELTHWDPKLAVSAAEINEEENRVREMEQRNLIIDRPLKFKRVNLPRGLNLSKGEMRRVSQFREMPYISPYSDFSELKAGSPLKEKHGCGVVHEILSLTLEKRTLVDHLTHFREEFRFSQQLRGMLIRHPDMFYVSLKGDRDSVFLREAYRDSQLIEKDRMLLLKEKLRALVVVPRFGRRMVGGTERETDRGPEEDGSEENGECCDNELVQDGMSDDDLDGDEGDGSDDYWSDDDDETLPEFDDNDNVDVEEIRQLGRVKISSNGNLKDQVPVLPDGRPRERW